MRAAQKQAEVETTLPLQVHPEQQPFENYGEADMKLDDDVEKRWNLSLLITVLLASRTRNSVLSQSGWRASGTKLCLISRRR